MRSSLRALALLLFASACSGCALPYYWQAIGGQIGILRKREPIAEVLADSAPDAETKALLRSVEAMRRFAIDDLHLPDNDSYTAYTALDRPYVVWNVIATEEFSTEPERWCFPFAGCVAYRGYFDRANAERFEGRLKAQGLDTYSGGSVAYSTLGYFDDPVLSTMLVGGQEYVAGVLFHELAHQKVYIKGDTELSEAFATTIEEYGVERWLRTHADEAAVRRFLGRVTRRAQFAELVARQQARLRDIYAEPVDADTMRERKNEAFAEMRREYAELKAQWNDLGDYDGWFSDAMNNATLVAIATYRGWVPALRWRLERVGLDAFFADIERLAELDDSERLRWLEAWREQRSAPGGLT
jgi:predicted aminopeptidase